LRAQEEEVRRAIEVALEKENLDREMGMAGEESSDGERNGEESGEMISGGVKSGEILLGDLDEIRRKVDRYQSRKGFEGLPDVKAKADAVVSCYSANPKNGLDCWRQVQDFKSAVAKVEHDYFNTLA
jgi:altered-inheritance-of-mitochondria protein 13